MWRGFCLWSTQPIQVLHNSDPVQMTAAERTLLYVWGTHEQGLSYCDPGATTATFWQGVFTVILLLTLTHVAASPDTSCSSMVLLLIGKVAAKGASCSPPVKLNTLLSAPSPHKPRDHTCRFPNIGLIKQSNTQETVYLRVLLSDFYCSPLAPTRVWEDNAAFIFMSENPVNRDRNHQSRQCQSSFPPPASTCRRNLVI